MSTFARPSTGGIALAQRRGGAPSTWGAIYDLYQYNMAQELGENFDRLKKLQGLVEFLPTKQPYIGFGESAPVDGTHDDNAEEQADRRVEVLFFAQGQEPDIALLDEDPHVSELYHPDAFRRVEIEVDFPMDGSKIDPLQIWLYDAERQLMPDAPYRLLAANGEIRTGRANADGLATEFTLTAYEHLTIQWGKREFGEEVEVRADNGLSVDPDAPPTDAAAALAYFEYAATFVLKKADRTITTMLGNLGHFGEESEQRNAFSEFYEESDNASIRKVYFQGKSA